MSFTVNLVSASKPDELAADLLVVGVHTSLPVPSLDVLRSLLPWVREEERFAVQQCLVTEGFTGQTGQSFVLKRFSVGMLPSFLLLGVGEVEPSSAAQARLFGAKAARAAQEGKVRHLALCVPPRWQQHLQALTEGLELGAYRFVKYLTGDKRPKISLEQVTLVCEEAFSPEVGGQIALGQTIGQAINRTRDLVNEPPNVMTPQALAEAAEQMAHRCGLGVQVFDFQEIQKRGMKLIQAVGQGSRNEPRFVHLRYTPSGKAVRRLVFLGKGITFDTGGISIKPSSGMQDMKADMAGAANMVGLMEAVAALQPSVEVHALMACAENMPDGNAYRPGDIWGSLDGKTVEIINTDAEGRLLLADGLAYARTLKPDVLIDNATLTGACMVALGASCSGFYATHDALAHRFADAAKCAGESMWHMPLLDDLKEQVKSDVADVKQTGERYGGSITAALFLREFVGDTKNWIHVDIAGPAYADKSMGGMTKGATGHGILTFLSFVQQMAQAQEAL